MPARVQGLWLGGFEAGLGHILTNVMDDNDVTCMKMEQDFGTKVGFVILLWADSAYRSVRKECSCRRLAIADLVDFSNAPCLVVHQRLHAESFFFHLLGEPYLIKRLRDRLLITPCIYYPISVCYHRRSRDRKNDDRIFLLLGTDDLQKDSSPASGFLSRFGTRLWRAGSPRNHGIVVMIIHAMLIAFQARWVRHLIS